MKILLTTKLAVVITITCAVSMYSACNTSSIPFTHGCFVPSLIEIGPVVLEEEIFKCHQLFSISYYLPLKKGDSSFENS